MKQSIITMITIRKAAIRQLGGTPVSMQQWEKDDDGLIYANSLLEQLEMLRED